MYELIKVGEKSYYIESPTKVGVVETGDGEVCLIDGGSDASAGRKILKILQEKNWKLRAIFNTHAHGDHVGGNNFLQSRTGCKIYTVDAEEAFARFPFLEPTLLYGAFPLAELCNKFLMAEPSCAEPLTEEVLPKGWEMIRLPGHTMNMVAFRTEDDVVYIADCVMGREALEKHPVTYLFDVKTHLQTLEMVKEMKAKLFIPSHAEVTEDIRPLAEYNLEKALEVGRKILEFCQVPISFETILKKIFDFYGHQMTVQQYALVGSTVRCYLAWLKDSGMVKTIISENYLLWQAEEGAEL